MNTAVDYLQKRPLCTNMIRDLRRILLTIARGGGREPGEICSIQNYITPPGTPIEETIFVPPSPLMVMDARSKSPTIGTGMVPDVVVDVALNVVVVETEMVDNGD